MVLEYCDIANVDIDLGEMLSSNMLLGLPVASSNQSAFLLYYIMNAQTNVATRFEWAFEGSKLWIVQLTFEIFHYIRGGSLLVNIPICAVLAPSMCSVQLLK